MRNEYHIYRADEAICRQYCSPMTYEQACDKMERLANNDKQHKQVRYHTHYSKGNMKCYDIEAKLIDGSIITWSLQYSTLPTL